MDEYVSITDFPYLVRVYSLYLNGCQFGKIIFGFIIHGPRTQNWAKITRKYSIEIAKIVAYMRVNCVYCIIRIQTRYALVHFAIIRIGKVLMLC